MTNSPFGKQNKTVSALPSKSIFLHWNRFWLTITSIPIHRGVLITKAEFLAMPFAAGMVKYESQDLDEVLIRVYESTAIVTGRLREKGAFQEQAFDEQFRITQVFMSRQARRVGNRMACRKLDSYGQVGGMSNDSRYFAACKRARTSLTHGL